MGCKTRYFICSFTIQFVSLIKTYPSKISYLIFRLENTKSFVQLQIFIFVIFIWKLVQKIRFLSCPSSKSKIVLFISSNSSFIGVLTLRSHGFFRGRNRRWRHIGTCGWSLSSNQTRIDGDGLCTIVRLVNPHETICQLKHVASQWNDDKLGVFSAFLDVVGHDGDVLEVQGSVDLVHHVERGGLVVVESKDQGQRRESFLAAWQVGNVFPGLFRGPHAKHDALREGVQRVHKLQLRVAAQRDHL